MANFTNADVMALRQKTGVGMMDCKKALVETNGNIDEAIKYLREKPRRRLTESQPKA